MNRIDVGPVTIEIAAPPALVFQMLAAIGQGAQQHGERAEVLEQRDGELVCDFWTRVSLPVGRDRLVRTRERVCIRPPDRIDYEHLDGPVQGLQETIVVGAGATGGSNLTYTGRYHPRGLADHLRATLLARPAIHRVMRAHFAELRERAEARANRSRVFATERSRP
ncbi:MAG: SRPBCC family protein [Gemmatimonadetes bacterium]|nr:SRPBCC family protein [Gemmatimonadota bacterium]